MLMGGQGNYMQTYVQIDLRVRRGDRDLIPRSPSARRGWALTSHSRDGITGHLPLVFGSFRLTQVLANDHFLGLRSVVMNHQRCQGGSPMIF